MQKTSSGRAVAFAAAALGLAVLAAPADDPAHARHVAMESAGEAMKPLVAIVKGQAAFDAAIVKKSATTIGEGLASAAPLFTPGSDKGETRAKPEIWTNKADFDKLMKYAQAAAAALAAVADEPAYRPAFGALGQSCKACHEKYRAPEM
jgi:cytochrome c556